VRLAGVDARLRGPLDHLRDGLGVRHQAEVSGVVLGDGGAGPCGHGPLDTGRDDLVLGSDEVPGRDRAPGGCSGWLTERTDRARPLGAHTIVLSSALSPGANDAKTVDFFRYSSVAGVGGRVAGTKSNTVVGSAESAESGPASVKGLSPSSGANALT
jgi:hypothetical protein